MTVACFFFVFFFSDRLLVINYDNSTRQLLLLDLTLLCHFRFLLLLAMSQRSLINCGVSKKKKNRAEEESVSFTLKIQRELYSVLENTINDNTAPLLRRFYKDFIYITFFKACVK